MVESMSQKELTLINQADQKNVSCAINGFSKYWQQI